MFAHLYVLVPSEMCRYGLAEIKNDVVGICLNNE